MEPGDLYGLPLDRFVPERGALARALRGDGRRAEASAVAGLRKPTVAAWAVNQLVRTQDAAVEDLFDAGDALREAQADVLAGRGDGRTLRAAGERERAAVDRLVDAARGLLSSEGHELGPAVVERVADSLHAAALDEDARHQVRGGRLERELRHVGLGLGEGLAAAPAPPPAPRAAKGASRPKAKGLPERTPRARAEPRVPAEPGARAERERALRQRAEAERAERERATAARKAVRAAEAEARRRLERAQRALRAADQRRERAAQALAEADAALAAAQEEADAAAEVHRRAKAELG